METLAEGGHCPGAGLEAGAAAALHHLHQQDDPVCVLAAGQKALDAQHLLDVNLLRSQLLCSQLGLIQDTLITGFTLVLLDPLLHGVTRRMVPMQEEIIKEES